MSGARPAPPLRGWARRGYTAAADTDELGPVTHGPVLLERDLPVSTADGTTLLADHWSPGRRLDGRPDDLPAPVVLVRTPYGRSGHALVGHLFAERGCHVVVNACRGTSGSGGSFEPFRDEVGDGRDVLRWVAGQPWAGPVHTFGFSYVGVTQWALCDGAPGEVASMLVGVSARSMGPAVFHAGGGTRGDINLIGDISKNMLGRTFCPLGDAAAMPTISIVEKFRHEFEEHLNGKPCPYEHEMVTV